MSLPPIIKRDEHGKNRFLTLAKFYEECNERFEKNYKPYIEKINKLDDKKLSKRNEQFMKYLKSPPTSIMRIIESSENIARLLYESKVEYKKDENELYFYHSFYIQFYFKTSIYQTEINNENAYKRDILQYIILIIFLKNQGHTLAYDIFLGWTVYLSQIFVVPHSNFKSEDIPLLMEGGKSKNTYFQVIKYVTYILGILICINPMNLVQFIRIVWSAEDSYQEIRSSYKNIINLDLEQQDYYWHFVDVYFKHISKNFNHLTIIMVNNFIELSYLQMKCAAGMFDKNSSNLTKNTLSVDSQKYQELFQFINKSIMPFLEKGLKNIQSNQNIDLFTKQIVQSSTGTILKSMLNNLKEKMQRYENKSMFAKELKDENAEEKQKDVTLPDNPFYFLKMKD